MQKHSLGYPIDLRLYGDSLDIVREFPVASQVLWKFKVVAYPPVKQGLVSRPRPVDAGQSWRDTPWQIVPQSVLTSQKYLVPTC
jgi:hypothetical protein